MEDFMEPHLTENNVRANCPDCNGSVTTFEYRSHEREYGYLLENLIMIIILKVILI